MLITHAGEAQGCSLLVGVYRARGEEEIVKELGITHELSDILPDRKGQVDLAVPDKCFQ